MSQTAQRHLPGERAYPPVGHWLCPTSPNTWALVGFTRRLQTEGSKAQISKRCRPPDPFKSQHGWFCRDTRLIATRRSRSYLGGAAAPPGGRTAAPSLQRTAGRRCWTWEQGNRPSSPSGPVEGLLLSLLCRGKEEGEAGGGTFCVKPS